MPMSLNRTDAESSAPIPCNCTEGFVSASARQGGNRTPQIRRYTHPIEKSRGVGRCEPMQALLCSQAGQNQVLCAIKAQLDEVAAALETLLETESKPETETKEEAKPDDCG